MILKFRVWHHELGRLMSVKCMFFQDSEIEEFELNDTLMNDYITAYPDEIELMQSTGILDKNGKEVFEGDIVRFFDSLYTVFYDIKDRWVVDYMSNFSSEESIEIIGNIYENLVYIFKNLEVEIEKIERRRTQNVRQRTFQISKHSTHNRLKKARIRNQKPRCSKWANCRNKQTYRNYRNQNCR